MHINAFRKIAATVYSNSQQRNKAHELQQRDLPVWKGFLSLTELISTNPELKRDQGFDLQMFYEV